MKFVFHLHTAIIATLLFVCSTNHITAQNADMRILRTINGWDGRAVRNYSKFFSESETYFAIAVPLGLGIYGLIDKESGALNKAVTVVGAMATTVVLTQGLKYIIDRKRPYEKYPDLVDRRHDSDSPSFPSSHTSMAFSVATSLVCEYPKWYVIVPSMFWATSVGFARINQGVHYPSDVVCGAIIGAASAYASYRVNKWWRENHRTRKQKASANILTTYGMTTADFVSSSELDR